MGHKRRVNNNQLGGMAVKAYYQLSGEEVLREVNGSEEPLTKEQVSENQKKYGPNELTEGKKKTTFQIFLEQYKDFLVIILIIAAIASGFMGDIESAAVIVIVITMNAILGTVQTVKAESSLASRRNYPVRKQKFFVMEWLSRFRLQKLLLETLLC